MRQLYLGFKAFDLHELTCHFVARYAGIYEAHDIQVRLLDTSFIADDQLPDQTFHASCGSATCNWLGGAPMKVVFVATDKPMFWLYARPEISSFDELAAGRVAGYPGMAPPAHFLRMIIKSVGLDPDRDLSIEAARDDRARLGLLRSGDAAAAIISAAVLPAEVQRFGFSPLAFFGDELRVPTTGLAVHRALLDSEPELVAAMSHCYLDSLQLIHEQIDVLHEVLREDFGITDADLEVAGDLVQSCYTKDGTTSLDAISPTLNNLQEELGLIGPLPEIPLLEPAHA